MKCIVCNENLPIREVNGAPYCEIHSSERDDDTEEDTHYDLVTFLNDFLDVDEFPQPEGYGKITHILDPILRVVTDLVIAHKDYDAALSRMMECFKKGYHLDSGTTSRSNWTLFLYLLLPGHIKSLVEKKDYVNALKILKFLTSPDLEEFKLCQKYVINIAIMKSICLQHFREFEEARHALDLVFWMVVEDAFYAGTSMDEDMDIYVKKYDNLFAEIYACAKREQRSQIMRELSAAGSIIEVKTADDDISVLRQIDAPDQLEWQKFRQFSFPDDAKLWRYHQRCQSKYFTDDFSLECFKMLEYLNRKLNTNLFERESEIRNFARNVRGSRHDHGHHQNYVPITDNPMVLRSMNHIISYCIKEHKIS